MPIEHSVSINVVKKIYSLIDLTSLNLTDNSATIAELCAKAVLPNAQVAAVCVYPQFVKQAVAAVQSAGVKIATVVNFPSGDESLESVLAVINEVIAQGADEIDVVFPYARYLKGEKSYADEFIRACKLASGNKLLKVILETGALEDLDIIADVSELAISAGADFLKTSTGKIAVGATLEAAAVMLLTIRSKAKRPVGFKVSGGVRTLAQAVQYVTLAGEMMGFNWVTPTHFRIGASQLADVLSQQLRS